MNSRITRFKSARLLSSKKIWVCELCDYKISSRKGMELHERMTHNIQDFKIKEKKKLEAREEIKKQRKTRIGECSECRKDMSLHSKRNGNCP